MSFLRNLLNYWDDKDEEEGKEKNIQAEKFHEWFKDIKPCAPPKGKILDKKMIGYAPKEKDYRFYLKIESVDSYNEKPIIKWIEVTQHCYTAYDIGDDWSEEHPFWEEIGFIEQAKRKLDAKKWIPVII